LIRKCRQVHDDLTFPEAIDMKKNIRLSKSKRNKMTGFRYRNRTSGGKKVIARRRRKGRKI
jgi:large subunit ribosomal protein L34